MRNGLKSVVHGMLSVTHFRPYMYILLLFFVLIYSVVNRRADILFISFICVSPISVVILLLYQRSNRRKIRTTANKLSQILLKASGFLDITPPKITLFDITIFNDTSFIWEDTSDSFLWGTTRMLKEAQFVVFSEQSRISRKWMSDTETNKAQSEISSISNLVQVIAQGIIVRDTFAVFEAIADILVLPLKYELLNIESSLLPDDLDDIVSRIEYVGYMAKESSTKEEYASIATEKIAKILEVLPYNMGLKNDENFKWVVLICYWLKHKIQIAFDPNPVRSYPQWLWADFYDILSQEVTMATMAYRNNDFYSLTEIIYESFDQRRIIPKFLI